MNTLCTGACDLNQDGFPDLYVLSMDPDDFI